MVEIDGSRYSGSGTIVRQAVVLSALTGQAVHIRNARAHRAKPGLQPQHIRVVEAICEVVQRQDRGHFPGIARTEFLAWQGPGWRRALSLGHRFRGFYDSACTGRASRDGIRSWPG